MNSSLRPLTPPASLISLKATSTPSRTLWPSRGHPHQRVSNVPFSPFIRFFHCLSFELQPDGLAVPQHGAVLLGPGLELVFLDLLARRLGQRIGELHEARHHEVRHVAVGKAHQFL